MGVEPTEMYLRFNERCSQCTRYAGRMRIVQTEHTLDDRDLCGCWTHSDKCTPIVHHAPGCQYFAAAIHCACLQPSNKNRRLLFDSSSHFASIVEWRTTNGTCSNDDNSSWSCVDVLGWTSPPWLLSTVYEPTSTLLATVWRNTSTFSTSPIISSVSCFADEIQTLVQCNCSEIIENNLYSKEWEIAQTLSKSGCTNAT